MSTLFSSRFVYVAFFAIVFCESLRGEDVIYAELQAPVHCNLNLRAFEISYFPGNAPAIHAWPAFPIRSDSLVVGFILLGSLRSENSRFVFVFDPIPALIRKKIASCPSVFLCYVCSLSSSVASVRSSVVFLDAWENDSKMTAQ